MRASFDNDTTSWLSLKMLIWSVISALFSLEHTLPKPWLKERMSVTSRDLPQKAIIAWHVLKSRKQCISWVRLALSLRHTNRSKSWVWTRKLRCILIIAASSKISKTSPDGLPALFLECPYVVGYEFSPRHGSKVQCRLGHELVWRWGAEYISSTSFSA